MELAFNNKLFSSTAVRSINVEITKLLMQRNLPSDVLNSEKKMFEALLDFVSSKGQKGDAETLIKHDPALKAFATRKFREHVEAGNAVNVKNYQECFEELKDYNRELVNIAHAMARKYPASIERHRIVELLKVKQAKRE